MDDYRNVKGYEGILKQFGSWPSFHDAEIVSILLDRDEGHGRVGPTITLKIHAFNMTSEITEGGYYKSINHAVITFYFMDVVDFELKYGFGIQNSISGFFVSDIRKDQLENINFHISAQTHDTAELDFKCARVEILAIEQGIPANSVYASVSL